MKQRTVIIHTDSVSRFVYSEFVISEDSHKEMRGDIFLMWFPPIFPKL
jgi:hypothetical protein